MSDAGRFFETLAIEIAAGKTIRAAAVAVGCSESHAYRLSSNQAFKAQVAELRTAAVTQAVGRLATIATEAVDVLAALLADEKPSVRLNAAKAILGAIQPMSEFSELRERIDRLEQASQAGGSQSTLRVVGEADSERV